METMFSFSTSGSTHSFFELPRGVPMRRHAFAAALAIALAGSAAAAGPYDELLKRSPVLGCDNSTIVLK
jgi:hypothetical protein